MPSGMFRDAGPEVRRWGLVETHLTRRVPSVIVRSALGPPLRHGCCLQHPGYAHVAGKQSPIQTVCHLKIRVDATESTAAFPLNVFLVELQVESLKYLVGQALSQTRSAALDRKLNVEEAKFELRIRIINLADRHGSYEDTEDQQKALIDAVEETWSNLAPDDLVREYDSMARSMNGLMLSSGLS